MRSSWIFFLVFTAVNLSAQNRFSVTLNLDTSIDLEKMSYRYYNGISDVQLHIDSLSHVVEINDDYYSEKAVLTVQYIPTEEKWHSESFFIDTKPATIDFKFDDKSEGSKFFARRIVNAMALYDTAENKLYSRLIKFIEKEAINMQKYWSQYGDKFGSVDSVTVMLKEVTRRWNDKAMLFFKTNNQEYFAFWWFKKQIVEQVEYCFKNDTSYFRQLSNDFLEMFPTKYTHSAEGERLLETLGEMISPRLITIGKKAPYFTSISASENVLTGIKEKYVLLHFWATWCIPCKKQVPMLQSLRDKALPGQLGIVSICQFSDSTIMNRDLRLHKFNWKNVYDKYNNIGRSFNVSSVPCLILVNQAGVVEYIDADNSKKSEDEILSIVNADYKFH